MSFWRSVTTAYWHPKHKICNYLHIITNCEPFVLFPTAYLHQMYIITIMHEYTPHRSLRSSSDKLLCVPRVNLKSRAGARSFQYQAPCVWNSVPIQTRLSLPLTSFKSSLKTHLFRNAFTRVSEIVALGMGWWRGGGGGGGGSGGGGGGGYKAWD